MTLHHWHRGWPQGSFRFGFFRLAQGIPQGCASALCLITLLVATAAPASAHHPFGGDTPQTWVEGFLSGLGHPIIGLDHLAFVVAAGLVAVGLGNRGWFLPLGFILGTLGGTGLHLAGLDVPGLETVISLSVVTFGLLLAAGRSLPLALTVALGAIAGLFHGHAYGEAVIGAEMAPLAAYLAGFALVQGGIALGLWAIASRALASPDRATLPLRFAGFTLLGIGIAFFSTVLLG